MPFMNDRNLAADVVADDYHSPLSPEIYEQHTPPSTSQTVDATNRSDIPEQPSPIDRNPTSDAGSPPFVGSQDSDTADLNFSQEFRDELEEEDPYSDDEYASSLDLSCSESADGRRQRLQQAHVLSREVNSDAASIVQEDEQGRAFWDPNDEFLTEDNAEFDVHESEACASAGEERGASGGTVEPENDAIVNQPTEQVQGLAGWDYASPLRSFQISVNDVDTYLEGRFVTEANTVLDNVLSRVQSLRLEAQDNGHETATSDTAAHNLSRLECFNVFLPRTFLEFVKQAANEGLKLRGKNLTTVEELQSVIIFHILCASYKESPTTIASKDEQKCFLQMGISTQRYKDIWSSFSTTKKRRSRVQRTHSGWRVQSSRASTLIFELEQSIASINREMMYVPGATVFSLDDNHARFSSRDVTTVAGLRQINNPCKALGPVNNAICSTLTAGFIAGHFSRPNEKTVDAWIRLVQLVQGVPTIGSLLPMLDAIFASDRGYNSQSSISLINEKLQATSFGTHKRSLDYPFGFGQGKIMKKYRGRVVAEQGCRALYSAKRKQGVKKGSVVEAIVYRESCTGRLAAMYHNNERLFGSAKFTVVPKNTFRGATDPDKVRALQVVFDGTCDSQSPSLPSDDVHYGSQRRHATRIDHPLDNEGLSEPVTHKKLKEVFGSVRHLTYYQSEDPLWFLLRAFAFTSRTTGLFFQVVAKDFQRNISSMSAKQKGVTIPGFDHPLPAVEEICSAKLNAIWAGVLETIGVQMGTEPFCSGAAGIRVLIISLTDARIQSMKVDELRNVLTATGRRPARSLRKRQLVEQLVKLVLDVRNGVEEFDEDDVITEADRSEAQYKAFVEKLRVASLKAWVMKPLVTTNGMKEGSLNEEHVLAALPEFLKTRSEVVVRGEKLVDGHVPAQYVSKRCMGYNVGMLQTLGLVCQKNNSMIADIPDGVCGVTDEFGDAFVAAVEVKTMTASRTIEEALEKQEKVGSFVVINGVGSQSESNEMFRKMVPTTAYRMQCLHHAAVLDVTAVIFVVAKGSQSTLGEISYVALLKFPSSLRHSYLRCIGCIQKLSFDWIGGPPKDVPKEYEKLVEGEYASDFASFISYYSQS